MASLDVREALDLLNHYLRKEGEVRTFTICGGAIVAKVKERLQKRMGYETN